MSFDLDKFWSSLPDELNKIDLLSVVSEEEWQINPLQAAITALKKCEKIDIQKYLTQYPDVKNSGIDPIEHYIEYGIKEKRKLSLIKSKKLNESTLDASKIATNNKSIKGDFGINDKKDDREKFYSEINLPGKYLDKNNLNIGFQVSGGMGDYLIFFNYLYYFRNKFKNERIHIETLFNPHKKIANIFLKKGDLSDYILDHPMTNFYYKNFDLFISFCRYPAIEYCDYQKIKLFDPLLLEYVLECEKFKTLHPRYFDGAKCDGQSVALSHLFKIKRIQQGDLYKILGISENYEYNLPVDKNNLKYIHNLGLKEKEFITFHRGCDTCHPRHVKLWPLDYYDSLIKMIKKEFPHLKLVQIGASHNVSGSMKGIDYNLVEKTSILQVIQLLYHSKIHIDNEGGMVHLRHALHAEPSIVLFGPTACKIYNYPENYNIVGKGCPMPCEWLSNTWMTDCIRGYDESPCMLSVVPDMVMDTIRRILIS